MGFFSSKDAFRLKQLELKFKLKHGVSIERENVFFLKSESRKKYSNNVLYALSYATK